MNGHGIYPFIPFQDRHTVACLDVPKPASDEQHAAATGCWICNFLPRTHCLNGDLIIRFDSCL